ncbi:endonuclease/exonuclease/phosphatase family protein [Paenibacillus sp. PL91]|uniref:endonuclease/exonuclease/phosphatase family protein n=1 Tax=Paenibacillus sp. PL91 TaxID=2729538 RepID=UPI00145E356D|nr:endonuclease/exonuclease/phosphatase family protein [Paenibacillus sp. PL91]MBC9199131.1 endonuclease/exonuclease/phosphatase family protein [Paenibacillus sp. PL91]
MELTVMSFNLRIHVEEDGENAWPNRIESAANAILASGAAVVGTQEGSLPMLESLSALLPGYEWIGEGRLGGVEGEYCAIFYQSSMLKPIESGTFGLSEQPEQLGFMSWNTACPRICTWMRLQHAEGAECLIFNTHLDHISEEARINGAMLIVDRMNMDGATSAILTGDFNCEPESRTIEILNQTGLQHTYNALYESTPGCTYHGFIGGDDGEPIDYIFVTPQISIMTAQVDKRKYNDRYPSDHYPIAATLQIQP